MKGRFNKKKPLCQLVSIVSWAKHTLGDECKGVGGVSPQEIDYKEASVLLSVP